MTSPGRLSARRDQDDIRDLHNVTSASTLTPDQHDTVHTRLVDNTRYLDALDRSSYWTKAGMVQLADLLMVNYLNLDPSKPCMADSYFSIERALLQGQPHTTCGGRLLADDVTDMVYAMHVNNMAAELGDGADEPYREVSDSFPYLAEPASDSGARFKARLFNTLLPR